LAVAGALQCRVSQESMSSRVISPAGRVPKGSRVTFSFET
jgi:hypothetical protein